MKYITLFCQYVHACLTVGLPAYFTDKALIKGDAAYIILAMAHYEKYLWDDTVNAWFSKMVLEADLDNVWTVKVTPRIFSPGMATFDIYGSVDKIKYTLRFHE